MRTGLLRALRHVLSKIVAQSTRPLKMAVISGVLLIPGTLGIPQELQHEVRVVNIEVPVRVFSGEAFVDNLTLNDFEIFENGIPQIVEAAYLIKKTGLERKEEVRPFNPNVERTFFLFFVVYEYTPKIRDAVGYFIKNVLKEDDQLFVVTPRTTYEMKRETFKRTPKEKVVDILTGIIRKDILAGDAAYRSILADLRRMTGSPTKAIEDQMDEDLSDMGLGFVSVPEMLTKYRADLERLENLRSLDQQKFFDFADRLKDKKGQKYVFFLYQREFTPTLNKRLLSLYETNLVLKQMIDDLFGLYTRTPPIDMDRLKKAYSSSSITVNFLYLTTVPQDIARDQMEERSWDLYQPFSEMASATGGVAASSSNAAALMEKASKATENYYLLYYSPKDRNFDGTFRRLEVRVRRGAYLVTHLAGYFAK